MQQALTTMLNALSCSIRQCQHSVDGDSRKFIDKSVVIRHLGSESHTNSLHLIDYALCQEVGIFSCSIAPCPCRPKTFLRTQAELQWHYNLVHSPPPPPTTQSIYNRDSTTPITPTPSPTITPIFPTPPSQPEQNALCVDQPTCATNIQICKHLLTSNAHITLQPHQ